MKSRFEIGSDLINVNIHYILDETGEISSMKQVVDEVVNSSTSLKKFHPQLAVDPFYETCFQGGKIGRLVVSFIQFQLLFCLSHGISRRAIEI